MSGTQLTRTSNAPSLATRALLLICLLVAAAVAAAGVVASIRSLTPPDGIRHSNGTIYEPMMHVSSGGFPVPPAFGPQPPNWTAVGTGVMTLLLFALVALLVWRLFRRRPFGRSLTVALVAAGCAVAATAGAVAVLEPGSLASGLLIAFVVAGILLVAAGLLASRGARLQRETDGLV